MSPSPLGRVPARGILFPTFAAALLLAAMGSTEPAFAQPTRAALESRFDILSQRYNDALSRFQQDRYNTEQAFLRVVGARASGDPDQIEQAFATHLTLAVEEMAASTEVLRIAEELRVAAEEMVVALEARENEILNDLNRTTPFTPESQAALRLELQRVRTRVRDADTILDRIGGGIGENLDLRPIIQLEQEPRDTPDDLRFKADVLEEQADNYETYLADLDALIAELERRERVEQARADVIADVNRFDANAPVVIPGGRTARLPPSVSAAIAGADASDALAQYSLAEQIELFTGIREIAAEYRDLQRLRARDFRVAAGGTPG